MIGLEKKPESLTESFKRFGIFIFCLEYYLFQIIDRVFIPENISFPKISIKKLVAKESKVNLLKEDNQYRNAHCEDCNCK